MTFTSKTKLEILKSKLLDKPSLSFASAVIHTAGSLSYSNYGWGFEFLSESKPLVNKTVKFVKELFDEEQKIVVDSNISPNKKNVYIVKYTGDIACEIMESLRIMDRSEELEIIYGIEEGLFETELDEKLYIIGAFLGCGSISVPETEGDSGYHLEFAFSNGIMADDFASLLLRNGFNPKFANRREKCLIYFKDKDSILDMLSFMQAMSAVIVINEIVAERITRNMVNRQMNCQLANIDKAVKAAEKQIEAINYIEKTIGFDAIDEKLKEISLLRRKNYDVGLEELGAMITPPISKSGVNHRLRKIVKIAQNIKDEEVL